MLKNGNGNIETCVNNLLQLEAGEVHLDQMRGIRSDLQDMPAPAVEPYYRANVLWEIENYEPRAAYDSLEMEQTNSDGDTTVTARMK